MNRNKALAKEILEVIVGEDNGGGGLYRSEIHGVFAERHPDPKTGRSDWLDYHLNLLETAGFVKFTKDEQGRAEDNFEMTWAGHDFLEGEDAEGAQDTQGAEWAAKEW